MVTREQIVAKASNYVGLADVGYKDNEFSRLYGIVGLDYCAAFVSGIFWYMGIPLPDAGVQDGFLYVPYAVDYARETAQAIEVPGQALPGDVVLFCWDGLKFGGRSAVGDHTGIVEAHDGGEWVLCIEGNTRPEGGGDRGIWRRWRHVDTIACYWRPLVFDGAFAPASIPAGLNTKDEDVSPEEHEMLRSVAAVLNVPGTGWKFPDGTPITTLPEFLYNLYVMEEKRDASVTALTQKTDAMVGNLASQMTMIVQTMGANLEALNNVTRALQNGIGQPAGGGEGAVLDTTTLARELAAEFGRRLSDSGLILGTGAINPPKPADPPGLENRMTVG